MVIETELLNKLKEFELNSYESKLWIALLSRGVSTAGELSDISNVPRSRAYDVLESLEKKGFIIVKIGKPIKYLAVPPREVIDRVKKRVIDDAEKKSKILSNLKESPILEELNSLHTEGIKLIDPTDRAGSFRGRQKVYNHLSTMLKNAKKSIFLVTSGSGIERKIDLFSNQLKKAHDLGVKINFKIPKNTDDKVIKECKSLGEVIHEDTKKARFCIIDDKEILLFLTDDKNVHPSYDSAIWLEAPLFSSYINKFIK